jgi:integrase
MKLLAPERLEGNRLRMPLRFPTHNRFGQGSPLRNWLMYSIARQCGLRRGELLKLRLDDVPRSSDPGLKIRRRPHDTADTRRYKPSVKTAERAIAISDKVRIGLRTYLSSPPPIGRLAGRSPYLFVSAGGSPLSIAAVDGIVKAIGRHSSRFGSV